MKLFCLPYAGGSSTIYSGWKSQMNSGIEVYPIELAGRGSRFNETLSTTIEEMVQDVYERIKTQVDEDSYAIFGHSMGSIIAYELICKLENEKKQGPKHVFFSGHKAPDIINNEACVHDLPDEEFKSKLVELGGTKKEFFEIKELCDIFMPIIRADFKAIENYVYNKSNYKLTTDITILYGKKEKLSFSEVLQWRNHTKGQTNIYPVEGDHFFINNNAKVVISIINSTLALKNNRF